MKPLVSILIPAYNAERTISQTLESAIAQTWPHKEIIVVNDGSTDRTLDVAQRYGSKVKVVSIDHQGGQVARNHAYSLSEGDFIQWLDADDLLGPEKIEKQLASLTGDCSERVLLSSSWASFYHRTAKAKFLPSSLWQDLSPTEWFLRQMGENLAMLPASWLTSRKLADAAGPWDTRLHVHQDCEYFARVLLASEGTRFISEAKVFYRIGGSKRVSFIGKSEEKKQSLLLTTKLQIEYLRSLEESERVRKVCLRYLQNVYYMFIHLKRPDLAEELQELARGFRGRLEEPSLIRKYAWIRPIFGEEVAQWAQSTLPTLKHASIMGFDKAMFLLRGDQE